MITMTALVPKTVLLSTEERNSSDQICIVSTCMSLLLWAHHVGTILLYVVIVVSWSVTLVDAGVKTSEKGNAGDHEHPEEQSVNDARQVLPLCRLIVYSGTATATCSAVKSVCMPVCRTARMDC